MAARRESLQMRAAIVPRCWGSEEGAALLFGGKVAPETGDQEESVGEGNSEDAAAGDVWPRVALSCVCPVFWSRLPHFAWTLLDCALFVRYLLLAVATPGDDEKVFEVVTNSYKMGHLVVRSVSLMIALCWLVLIVQLQTTRTMVFDNQGMRRMLMSLRAAPDKRDAFDRDFSFDINFITAVVPLVGVPLIAALDYGLHHRVGGHLLFFTTFLGPTCLGGWQATICNLALRGLTEACRYEVESFLPRLEDALRARAPLPKNFWNEMLREHRSMDRRLEAAIGPAAAGTYMCLLAEISIFVFINMVSYSATQSKYIHVACVVATGSVLGFSMYVFLKGPADVTTLCCSKKHKVRSVHTLAIQFFGWEGMDQEGQLQHSIFIQYLDTVMVGFEIPFIGVISMEFLMSNAKVLATVFPILLAYIIHK